MQLYYFWKKLCLNYKSTHLKSTCPSHYETNSNNNQQDDSNNNNSNNILYSNPMEFFDLVNTDTANTDNEIELNQPQNHHQNSEIRSHICEMPDCSAVKRSLYH